MGIGGGIITRKLLFAVFLIASLSLSGISNVSALEDGTAQTQTSNTDTVKKDLNTQANNANVLKETATTQKSAEKSVKSTNAVESEQNIEPNNVQKIGDEQQITTQNTNTEQQTTAKDNSTVTPSTAPQQTPDNSTENSVNQSTANSEVVSENTTVATQAVAPETNSIDNSTNTGAENQNTVTNQEELAAAGDSYTNMHGIWLKAEDINNISVTALKNANITDIFVKTNLVSTPTYKTVLSSITSKFQDTGIRIHAWITCFKDADGKWIDPANTTQRTFLLNSIKDIVKNYNINGIQLDYVRYSGVGDNAAYKNSNATATVTSFVKDVYNAVKAIKPKVAVSTALMPEGENNAKIYGQDYKALAPYVDFLVPMIYKGNYGQDTAWIGSVTKYIVDQAGGKPVIAGLQTYVSDYDTTKLPASELNTDINSATDNGASGYALFRYGTIGEDFINPPSFTISEIKDAASRIKSYIDSNHRLPSYVTIDSSKVSMSEFLKLMTRGLIQLNSGITTPIKFVGVSEPQESTGTFTTGNIDKTEYMGIAERINAFIDSGNNAPNYATSSLGKIRYESVVYMFAKIFGFYNTNSNLPSYVSMNSAMKVSPSPSGGSMITVFSLDQIQKAATNVKKYIETNHKLPSYVTVGTTRISPTDFLRLMLIGTMELDNGAKMPLSLKGVKGPSTPTESIKSGDMTKSAYLDLAQRIKAFIDANGKLPNHATTTLGEIKYQSLVYMFAKILSFEDTNNRLPSTVSVKPWSTISTPPSEPVPASLQSYLSSTANCQVTNSQIKALAAKITAGKTSTYSKAAAIFNWVRDNIGYSFYYNTRYGAVGTLNADTGNCVDTSHLVIALSRAAGLPARYVHGRVRFSSGNVYGHVWAQIWVNGKWYTADGTSSRNSLGYMSGTVLSISNYYRSLPF